MSQFSYEVLRQVVLLGTFAKAATALNVTPSAISHSISQLETELGFPLLIRNRTGVELTPDGQQVLPIVQSILNLEEQLSQVADSINGTNSGRIRLGAFSSVSTNWLPTIIQRFKKKYPHIDITVVQGGFKEIVDQVRLGSVDIGFSALPIESGVVVEPVISDPIYCVTPKRFKPANGRTVTAADVAKRHFILQQMDYDGDTKEALDRYQVSGNTINYSIDDQSILSMVESGLGLGILPELALQKLVGEVNVYPFSEAFARTLCIVINPTIQKSPSVQRMHAIIQDYLAERYGEGYLGKQSHVSA